MLIDKDAYRRLYRPQRFDVADIESAKNIILTPEPETTTDERWVRETRFLCGVVKSLQLERVGLLLDYGCGIGRLPRELLRDGTIQSALGLDISARMRALATQHVDDPRFAAISPELGDALAASGLRCDLALCVWVLQHAFNPLEEIDRLDRLLAGGAHLIVLNTTHRCVPIEGGWADDHVDVRALLEQRFRPARNLDLEPDAIAARVREAAYAAVYRKS